MKNKILALLTATMLIASCTKEKNDNQDSQTGGTITFSGAIYDMKTGLQQYYGLVDGKHFINVYLYSKEIEVLYQNGNLSLDGTGTVVSLELWKDGASIEGVYNLANDSIIKVQLLLNQSYTKDSPPATLEFSGGTVTIGKSGENYRFNFNIRSSYDVPLAGSFNGPLLYFDYSDKLFLKK